MKLEYAVRIERLAENDGGATLRSCQICRVACRTGKLLRKR